MIATHIDRVILDQYPGNLGETFAHYFRNRETILKNPAGRYEVCGEFFYLVQEYETKDPAAVVWESHRKYIDLQIVCEGEEAMEFSDVGALVQSGEDAGKDFIGWNGEASGRLIFRKGDLAVFYPEDAHRPGLRCGDASCPVRKIVYKILLD